MQKVKEDKQRIDGRGNNYIRDYRIYETEDK